MRFEGANAASLLLAKMPSGLASALAALLSSPAARTQEAAAGKALVQHLPGHPFAGAELQATGYALHNKMLLARCCIAGALPAQQSAGTVLLQRGSCALSAPALTLRNRLSGRRTEPDWRGAWSCRSALAAHRSGRERVQAAAQVSGHAPAGLRRLRGARVGRCTLPHPGARREGPSRNANYNGAAGRGGARVSAIPHRGKHLPKALRPSGFCRESPGAPLLSGQRLFQVRRGSEECL